MKFNKFIKIYQNAPLIDSSTFSLYEKAEDLRRQVRDWVRKGYLLPLKKGIYIFSEEFRKIQPSVSFIANFLLSPSYLSLDYALGIYNLIPEKVNTITSVTTKKTSVFDNTLGRFEYFSVKENLFFGFKKESENGNDFFIAAPEKALIDYFYLNSKFKGEANEFDSLRLQNLDILDIDLLHSYGEKYNDRVNKIIIALVEYIDKFKKNYRSL